MSAMNVFRRCLLLSVVLTFIWVNFYVDNVQAGVVRPGVSGSSSSTGVIATTNTTTSLTAIPAWKSKDGPRFSITASEEQNKRNEEKTKLITKLKQGGGGTGGRKKRDTKNAFNYFYEFLVDKGLNRICKLFREAQLEDTLTSVGCPFNASTENSLLVSGHVENKV